MFWLIFMAVTKIDMFSYLCILCNENSGWCKTCNHAHQNALHDLIGYFFAALGRTNPWWYMLANHTVWHTQTPYNSQSQQWKSIKTWQSSILPNKKYEKKTEQPCQDHTTDGWPLISRNIVGAGRSLEMATVTSYTAGTKLRIFWTAETKPYIPDHRH